MKKIKNLVALLLTLALAFSLAACSSSKNPIQSNEPSPSVEPSESAEPSPSTEPLEFDLTNAKEASEDDLIGTWNYIALKKNGEWKEMDAKFVITAQSFVYGEYASSITFIKNVMNILDWGCTMTCWYNPAGQLIIEDSRDMYYVCEGKTDNAEQPSAEHLDFDVTNAKDATKDDLIGTWNYVGLQKDGQWTKMADKFVITANSFTYGQYASSVTFNKNVMNIVDWGCTMTCWYNPAGQLIIEDSRGMYYVCEGKE